MLCAFDLFITGGLVFCPGGGGGGGFSASLKPTMHEMSIVAVSELYVCFDLLRGVEGSWNSPRHLCVGQTATSSLVGVTNRLESPVNLSSTTLNCSMTVPGNLLAAMLA